MKRYIKNVLFILSIIVLFVAVNVLNVPNNIFSNTYALVQKYVFSTKDATPKFTVGNITYVYATKSDGTKYDKMYINKLGKIVVPITDIANVTSKNDFNVTVTCNNTDVTSNFVITKTDISNKSMTITLEMKEGTNYSATTYKVNVSVSHEWEEEETVGTTKTSRVKIIRAESIGEIAYSNSSSKTNNWNEARIQSILKTSYLNAYGDYVNNGLTSESQYLMSSVNWYIGAKDSTSNNTALDFYEAERATSTDTWAGYVGLIYPSDFGYAIGGSTRSTCLNTSLSSYATNCSTNNWLSGSNTWTMTALSSSDSKIYYIASNKIDTATYSETLDVNPVVFLDADVAIVDGTGTKTDPYIIEKNSVSDDYLVNVIKKLAASDTTNLATDDTSDKNIRYIGKNPSNYVYFNDELWRIVGVMNNITGNDGVQIVEKNNTVTDNVSFALVGKYYNFEGEIETITNYKNNPSNKVNKWEITLDEFEEIDTSKFTYTLKGSDGVDYTSSSRFTITKKTNTSSKVVYEVKNSKYIRPKSGTYIFTVSYYNSSVSTARGTITKTFNIIIGGREVTFEESIPVESHNYIRTASTQSVSLQVTSVTTSSITFREGTQSNTMEVDDFLQEYTGTSIQDIRHIESGDVVYAFTLDDTTYMIYRIYNNVVYYINLESEETDDSGNIVDHFQLSKDDFETTYPGQIAALEASSYSIDSTGDIYCSITANKRITILSLATANKVINAAGGGVFYFNYVYSGLEEDDLSKNLTYKIFNSAGKEFKTTDGFTVTDMVVTASTTEEETGSFSFTLDYNNTDDTYVGDYYIRFYINDGNETITKDVGFSLYDSEIDYYVQNTAGSNYSLKYSNQQINQYIGFYLRKGAVAATSINPNNISIKIYDSRADLDSNGNIYYYDLVNYELQLISKLNNVVTFEVYENATLVGDGPLSMSVDDFKTSDYYQAAELLDYYKFDTSGNLITDSTNYVETEGTAIEIISSRQDEDTNDKIIVYKENGVQKESTLTQFKVDYPNMHGYIQLNLVFDQDGDIITGRLMGNYRTNDNGEKEGHDVTDQFQIFIDETGENLEHAIVVLPATEVLPQEYYAYVAYGNLKGVGHVNDDPDTLITKAEFPEQWLQNSHMTTMSYDDPEYGIELDTPTLTNVGDDTDTIYDNIAGTATFDLTISDTFLFTNKFTYEIYYHDTSDGLSSDAADWGSPIQTSESANKVFEVTSDLFSMTERDDLEPYVTTLTLDTIDGVDHPKGEYKIILYYSNNGVTNTGEQTFKIGGKYYGLVLNEEETDELSYIRNYTETKNIVFDGYYISNYNNIDIVMIQENSSGDITLTRTSTSTTSGKFSYGGEDKFTYEIYPVPDEEDSTHYVYTFKLTNIKDKPYEGTYHLNFVYQESGGDETTTSVEFVVNAASYSWEISEEDTPTVNENVLYFTKDIETTYIEDFNQFVFTIEGWDSNSRTYVDVSSDDSKDKQFESIELIDQVCEDYTCTAKVKITLTDDTDKDREYYLVSQYLTKDDETPISDLNELFAWSIKSVRIIGSYYDETQNEDYIVDGFYKNIEDTTIDITLDTVRTDAIHWELNRDCLQTSYACEVNTYTNYNDFLTEASNGNKRLRLTVDWDYLSKHELKVQTYALVLYFSASDYKIYNLEVHGNYVLLKFGDAIIQSFTTADNTSTIDGLFKNKNGKIYVPVSIAGITYDDPLINITLTNSNGDGNYFNSQPFAFNKDDFVSNKYIDISYSASSASTALAQDYLLSISYNNGEETFEDRLEFTLNEKYFNFEISDPTYDPSPLVPNKNGKVTFTVVGEDIPNLQYGAANIESASEKYTMMNSVVITNNSGKDVTDKFTKSVANSTENSTFTLTLAYTADTVDPGDYTIRMSYELEGYTLTKEQTFSIGNDAKELEISSVEIITTTTDGRIHKNIDGTYRLYYESAYNINPGYISVNVLNGTTDITSKFDITVQQGYIDVKYSASANLDEGDFTVVVTYQDDEMEVSTETTQDIKLYGTYKVIDIQKVTASSSTILADIENQYYTLSVYEQPIKDDIDYLKWIITDSNGNDVTKQFAVTKPLESQTSGCFDVRVAITPFASPVGEYYIRLYLLPEGVTEDTEEERMYSNTVGITINNTYYKVNLSSSSTLSQVTNYDTSDKTSIYDKDGAKGDYQFTSTYPLDDLSKFTLALTDSAGKVIDIIDANIVNDNGSLSVEFATGSLDNIGSYKVMICINGLPYSGLDMTVVQYIAATNITMRIDNSNVGTTYAAHSNTTYNPVFVVEPSNATNKNYVLTSSDTSIATISGTSIITKGTGSTVITVTNGDVTVTSTFNVSDYLTSSTYTVDNTNYTVFVSTMTKKELTVTDFMANLTGYTSYEILTSSGTTSTSSYVGTGMQLKVSGGTYTITVIGDLTGDGIINTTDVSWLYQYLRSKRSFTTYQQQASKIRKTTTVSTTDVAWLYQFILGRNNRTSI